MFKTSRIEILTIGDELLRGELTDTNSAWIAARLHERGLAAGVMASVGDGLDEIAAAVGAVASRSGTLVVSGGLGPTDDDRTTEAVARAAGVPLERDATALAELNERFRAIGLEMTPNNRKQADFPRGARIIPNPAGTAPGFSLEIGGCLVLCLPGVPRELRAMFDATVAPLLCERLGAQPATVRRYKVFGLAEAQVDHRLEGLLDAVQLGDGCEASVHYRATFPEIHVTQIVRGAPAAAVEQAAQALEAETRARLGRYLFAEGQATFADAVVAVLRQAGATLALAESCTGGQAGDLITSAAGSSEVFVLSAVTYANQAKHRLLGVPEEVLERDGAVSRACVEAMARGVRQLADTTYGVAISGIAGPGGGSHDKPVGTVHFAIAGPEGTQHVHRVFRYDRARVKQLAAHVALWLVYRDLVDRQAGRAANVHSADSADELLGGRWQPGPDARGDGR